MKLVVETITPTKVGAGTAVKKYNGIYMKQGSLVNGMDWWKQRYTDAAHLTDEDAGASIYWSDTAERWLIEASDVIWEAPTTTFNDLDDDRHFPGLQMYFGNKPSVWNQNSIS